MDSNVQEYPIEVVVWLDHQSAADPHRSWTLAEIERILRARCKRESIGRVVYETDEILVLVPERRIDDDMDELLYYGWFCILKIALVSRAILTPKESADGQ